MPKKKKLVESSDSKDKLPETKDAKRRRRKTNAIIVASAILVVIIAVSVVSWYLVYRAPLLAPVIVVNNKTISVEYLLKRCLINTSAPNNTMGTIQNIIQENVIEQVAAQPPYNIKVTEADIDQELRNEANSSSSGSTTTTPTTTATATDSTTTTTATTPVLSDAEFKAWYRERLDLSQLSESQFRDIVRVQIMASRLNTYLEDRMSTTAEQVHLYDIVLPDSTTAIDIMNRINNGEDFQTIAEEKSQDTNTAGKGGDLGWVPLKVLDSNLEFTAANLEIGKVSSPVQLSTAIQSSSSSGQSDQTYYLLMVTAKAESREIDPQYFTTLQLRLLEDWLDTTTGSQKVQLKGKGALGGYDSQSEAWLQYEIEKLKASRGITETTTTTTNPATGQ